MRRVGNSRTGASNAPHGGLSGRVVAWVTGLIVAGAAVSVGLLGASVDGSGGSAFNAADMNAGGFGDNAPTRSAATKHGGPKPTASPSAAAPTPPVVTPVPSTPVPTTTPPSASATPIPPAPSGGISVVPSLATGRIAFSSDRGGSFGLYSMRTDGGDVRLITADSGFDSWWPRISPDRTRLIFYRTPKGVHDTDYRQTALWMVNADGSGLRELRPRGTDGWDHQGHAEWSPDGTRLLMFGGELSNPQIFVTRADGSLPLQVTDRPGTNLDPSWSRDGRTIVFVGCPQAVCYEDDYEIYSVPTQGGEATRLTSNRLRDHDPYFSPDGGSIAWLSRTDPSGVVGVWNIRLMNTDGSDQRPVTNDGHINSKPAWARDGSLIYFHRFELGRSHWGVYSIRPDGTGMQELTTGAPGNNEYPDH